MTSEPTALTTDAARSLLDSAAIGFPPEYRPDNDGGKWDREREALARWLGRIEAEALAHEARGAWSGLEASPSFSERMETAKRQFEEGHTVSLHEVVAKLDADPDVQQFRRNRAEYAALVAEKDGEHPPEHCQLCREPYTMVYRVPDELWVLVTRRSDGSGLLCPFCFDAMADANGLSLYWTAAAAGYPTFHGVIATPDMGSEPPAEGVPTSQATA